MSGGSIWLDALSWVLTYLAHSTLLLSAAWCLARLAGSERLRLKERIWKTALVGGLLTATAQVSFDVAPLAGRLDLGPPAEVVGFEPASREPLADTAARGEEGEVLAARAAPAATGALAERFSWPRLLLGIWFAGGAIGVLLLFLAWRRIADFLAGRRRLRRGTAVALLRRLSRRAGLRRPPRLSASHRLRSPATVGIFAPQICIPYRALTELTHDQQEALLAHELAHIVRRDPLWFLVCRLVERALFFQPLNRVAGRELQEIAEFLADDWAAQRTRRELALARCLTEVATWVLDRRPVVAVVPMASRNSRLAARITRLLDEERTPQDHRRRPSALLGPGLLLVAALASMPGAAAIAPPTEAAGPTGELSPVSLPVPPPASRSAAAPELTELLRQLDEEVEALAREVEELHRELETFGVSPRQADTFRLIGARLTDLGARRARLHQLIPALQARARGGPPAARTTDHNPPEE